MNKTAMLLKLCVATIGIIARLGNVCNSIARVRMSLQCEVRAVANKTIVLTMSAHDVTSSFVLADVRTHG